MAASSTDPFEDSADIVHDFELTSPTQNTERVVPSYLSLTNAGVAVAGISRSQLCAFRKRWVYSCAITSKQTTALL